MKMHDSEMVRTKLSLRTNLINPPIAQQHNRNTWLWSVQDSLLLNWTIQNVEASYG